MPTINYYDKKTNDYIPIGFGDGTPEIAISDTEPTGDDRPAIWVKPSGIPKPASNDYFDMLEWMNVPMDVRRMNYRGKNLGSTFTAAQKDAIKDGTFKGFFLGDYWAIGGQNWRIVDFDYWWNFGDTACKTHHLVIMPDGQLYQEQMNEADDATGAYVNSKMYKEGLDEAKTIINGTFGSNYILNHREFLHNATKDGYASSGEWYDSTVELPNEIMMYGSYIYTPVGNGTILINRNTLDNSQLAGMMVKRLRINSNRSNCWLRDVVEKGSFALTDASGRAARSGASNVRGVRPVFGLTG